MVLPFAPPGRVNSDGHVWLIAPNTGESSHWGFSATFPVGQGGQATLPIQTRR